MPLSAIPLEQEFGTLEKIELHKNPDTRKNVKAQDIVIAISPINEDNSSTSSKLSTSENSVAASFLKDNIEDIFICSRNQWIDDPVISQWRHSSHPVNSIIKEVSALHRSWSDMEQQPFSPTSDPLWRETGSMLTRIGLPWFNNQLSMPDEIDTSWPFHFKSYEQRLVREKGSRVGNQNASGYVCTSDEANCYCIRALQQELRVSHPNFRPLLVYDNFERRILHSVETMFGLQTHHLNLSRSVEYNCSNLKQVTEGGRRPIIFAATLASIKGTFDDLTTICKIVESSSIPTLLHVDASRNFDYITTLPEEKRRQLGVEKIILSIRPSDHSLRLDDSSVIASSIVAGGANHTDPALTVALKPSALGGEQVRVAYIRAFDSTLAGSRDAISALWVALQEIRFGLFGFREIYRHCASMRSLLLRALKERGVIATAPCYSLDVVFHRCTPKQAYGLKILGGIRISDKLDDVLITVQPSVKPSDIKALVRVFSPLAEFPEFQAEDATTIDSIKSFQLPKSIVDELSETVQSWKVATRSAAGYPLNMGPCSALGPVIGRFWDVVIPRNWLRAKEDEFLGTRMQKFGLQTCAQRSRFRCAFTNGSTMGNRLGIHAALARLPEAFIYFSSETHYSVTKTLRDCDSLKNHGTTRKPRYTEIPCNQDGSISISALKQQALEDQKLCWQQGKPYHLILFANTGTTFLGARDDLKGIYSQLSSANIEISHIHVDGAFDLGYGEFGITLGLPGTANAEGMPSVQGITISHHKVLGTMICGEVYSFMPEKNHNIEKEASLFNWGIDPRIIFESWLYTRVFQSTDIAKLLEYCQNNAARLVSGLRQIGVVTKRNPESTIVVLERPPSWIVEEFCLRPEEDWVHFIALPHISPETIDLFVKKISWIKTQCLVAFSYVNPSLDSLLMRPVKLKILKSQDPLAKYVFKVSAFAVPVRPVANVNIPKTINSCIRSAMSTAIIDEHGRLEAVLMIESNRDFSIQIGPLLVRSQHIQHEKAMISIAKQLAGFMARNMNVKLNTNALSYEPLRI
ncbi:hypothetical protein TWF694_007773 [Orbilia ellipsospora]|uniref:Histidine decarboxylase n=1 Tax=Orbilia ellipsospora TaxID=2528407 RepID=A0AAV9XKE2_9PEZI